MTEKTEVCFCVFLEAVYGIIWKCGKELEILSISLKINEGRKENLDDKFAASVLPKSVSLRIFE